MQRALKFFDPFRKKWVTHRPEEVIRVNLLHKMINELSYPFSLIAIEKEFHTLPHVSIPKNQLPKRRIDIVVFGKDLHPDFPLFPLLLIECKAETLTAAHKNQIIGYNDIVRAPYIALANENQTLTGTYNLGLQAYHFVEGIPNFTDLKTSSISSPSPSPRANPEKEGVYC